MRTTPPNSLYSLIVSENEAVSASGQSTSAVQLTMCGDVKISAERTESLAVLTMSVRGSIDICSAHVQCTVNCEPCCVVCQFSSATAAFSHSCPSPGFPPASMFPL